MVKLFQCNTVQYNLLKVMQLMHFISMVYAVEWCLSVCQSRFYDTIR